MIMETLKFKSNIKCAACVATVTPALNGTQGIEKWEVDLTSPDRILTVQSNGASAEQVREALQKVGYAGEIIS
jgi:copper chaperone